MDEQKNRKAQQARRKNDKKTRAEKTYEAFEKNLDAEQSKMKRTQKLPFKDTREGLAKFIDDTYDASKRETAARMAKGGRVGLKSGSKGCKLAMKGKGRAYGKNS
jgi:type VI protein secretion system component VasK